MAKEQGRPMRGRQAPGDVLRRAVLRQARVIASALSVATYNGSDDTDFMTLLHGPF